MVKRISPRLNIVRQKMAIRMQMNRFTSNLPRPLVSTEPVIKPQKLPSPVAIPPAKPTPTIPSPIMPSAETLSSELSQSCSNSSEVIEQQEKPQEEAVRTTSEQELTERGAGVSPAYPIEVLAPSKLPESRETSQCPEPPSSSSESLQQPEEHEVPAQEESVSPGKIYYSSPRMRLPPPVD